MTLTVSNPIKKGYIFAGWTVIGEGVILSGTNLTIGTSNVILTANWILTNELTGYQCANISSGEPITFTYTGDCSVIDDGDGDWRVKFLTDGIFNQHRI